MNRAVEEFFREVDEFCAETRLGDPPGPPTLTPKHIKQLEAKLADGVTLPDVYKEFLLARGFTNIDAPFVNFESTQTPFHFRSLRHLYGRLGPSGFAPVGGDVEGEGVFCIDLRDPGRRPVVLVRYHADRDEDYVVGPLCSSFEAFLRVVTAALATGVGIGVPNEHSPAAVADLKALDPGGFGGPGWRAYWSRRLRRYTNPPGKGAR